MRIRFIIPAFLALGACSDLEEVGRLPEFTPVASSSETSAMRNPSLPERVEKHTPADSASLWTSARQSLLGDRRAIERGDILTVVIEIDDSAEMSNSSDRSRSGSETMGLSSLFGIPERINEVLPDGATMGSAVNTNSNSASSGDGSIKRNEKLELMVAATIVDVLPNGVLHIQGSQEVRVNYEIRELLVEGYVRPEDISRQNEITYDKIASARISYGGRGQLTQVQQPRYGQQIADIVLPF
ncbi:flagellar basal body L-ring protein FlgH [Celeribacter halophilus]|uniref:Flagellar L-ring protein n=1 Tax=Celeribacter halophilus TaxID=576117 RepID=A0AAW7Y0N1_9RHOB|nr:flagellar basal body L-ring protein FlgH [Celeribacter halophilus]MDO6458385.1 flagellar basal body L-ring protein FlgH [Celeribacter halophilus]MDO6724116.1 flagellar basal body L-ring protein FlgH [Celeribacter halophilus]